jgi:hypothetical protein
MTDLIAANQLLSVILISTGAGILMTLGALSPFLFAFIYNQNLKYSTTRLRQLIELLELAQQTGLHPYQEFERLVFIKMIELLEFEEAFLQRYRWFKWSYPFFSRLYPHVFEERRWVHNHPMIQKVNQTRFLMRLMDLIEIDQSSLTSKNSKQRRLKKLT